MNKPVFLLLYFLDFDSPEGRYTYRELLLMEEIYYLENGENTHE